METNQELATLRQQLAEAKERADMAEKELESPDYFDFLAPTREFHAWLEKYGLEACNREHLAELRARLAASEQANAALRAEVERLTGIERSYNAQRNLPPDQRTIPDDDAGRAAYWKGRAKAIEGDLAKLSDALLKEGEAKDAFKAAADRLAGLLSIAECPACDGSGVIVGESHPTEYVSREMALDAGDPSLEGSIYRTGDAEVSQCQWCDERKQSLVAHAKLTEGQP